MDSVLLFRTTTPNLLETGQTQLKVESVLTYGHQTDPTTVNTSTISSMERVYISSMTDECTSEAGHKDSNMESDILPSQTRR